jgi:glyoxylase-like metal-dependent hydrolase (beta-lactamase superfamily II)
VSDATLAAGAPGSADAPALLSGDTLFVQGCGRVDLPGSDSDEMYRTLTERLARLPATTILMPGHDYGPTPTAPLSEVRRTNPYLLVPSLEEWRRTMGS